MARKYNDNEKRFNFLRRTAQEARSYRIKMKVLTSVLIMLVIAAGLLYGVSALYKRTGSFTVSINKYEMTEYGLTLSESREMTHKTSHLNADINEHMTNIAGESIPANVDMIDGEHNGDNYVAYTFYVQNAGAVPVAFEYKIAFSNVTNNLEDAIRIRLYVNGEATTYAKTATDGSGAEPGTKEFYASTIAAFGRIDDFEPEEITKFTVVIWIEGNDPDCVDRLLGGQMNISMHANIAH